MNWLFSRLVGASNFSESLVWLQRRETWYADFKTNHIRLFALGLFTFTELITYSVFHAVDRGFHIATLLILLLWWTAAGSFQWATAHHYFPRRLPYLMVAVDLVLLTALLSLGDGTQSSLVVIYFLIVALSSFRLNPLLVLYSAAGACGCYLSLFIITWGQWASLQETALHATIIPLSLALMGLIISNWIQRVLKILDEMLQEGRTS